MKRILEAATKRRDASTPRQQQQSQDGGTNGEEHTAATFARTAPRAGFLSKLGTNIPEFKRRFFVLKPSTHLYYFLSPADTEPRGCIDLEGASVQELNQLPNGTCRFAITLEHGRRIVLEARSQDVGRQWMESMNVERLSHAKQQVAELMGINAEYKARIESLEKQLEEYRMVEHDRDGALEDAANWKSQFERLNEGLRLLTQHLRRPPEAEPVVKEEKDDGTEELVNKESEAEPIDEEKKEEDKRSDDDTQFDTDDTTSTGDDDENSNDATPQSTNKRLSSSPPSTMKTPQRDTSLLDDIGDDEQQIDDLEFPGTHFSALLNACQQLRESLRLASVEASSAVEDLTAANETVFKLEKRMAKAEKHICKLWEENCAMRKTLKQNKAEKRVLVKEVKSLMGVVNSTSQKLRDMSVPSDRPVSRAQSDDASSNFSPTEEERLIDELEEHVMTSIRLHEQFLGVNSGLADQLMDSVKKIESGSYVDNNDDESEPASRPSSRLSLGTDSSATLRIEHRPVESRPTAESTCKASNTSDMGESANLSPIKPTILSLFDDESDDDEESSDEEASRSPSLISSVGAEFGDALDDLTEDGHGDTASFKTDSSSAGHSQVDPRITLRVESQYSSFAPLVEDDKSMSVASLEEERKHPILQLDEEVDGDGIAPNLCASSTQSESSKSIITDTGNATSRLTCPLADVVGTNKKKEEADRGVSEDGKVYHLTFYSRKIGLQFQKVPAEHSPRGLLTEAMTTDLPVSDRRSFGDSTSADLKRIAAISSMANASHSTQNSDEVCQVATPLDAVLVCGFHGFMDEANHTRPKLGARLVAFDGVSVEVGRWTFDSIRKAIQARGRPLTLSFRNDFLTMKQRAILTKAVADVEKAIPPLHRTIHCQQKIRPPSTEPTQSIISSQSHETDHFINDACPPDDDDDLSVSVASTTFPCSFGRSYSTSQASVGSYQNFRSFSEAGSSSVFSSTSHLVGNLMNGLSKKKSGGVPKYLRSDAASLENQQPHQDFTSNLL